MKRLTLVLAVALAFFVAVGVAGAAWIATGTGSGYSKGLTMPTGNTPSVSVSGVDVTVSWTANTIGGAAVSGYNVERYNTSDVLQSIGSACTGLVASTSCIESSAPAGRWKYKVKPVKDNWLGTLSAFSAQAHVVGAPTSVACGNCGGVGSAYINTSMSTNVTINVGLPSTSETGDVVHLTLSDGTNTVTPATKAGTNGVGSVQWTAVSTATLNQGTITFTAWVTEGGSTSANTTAQYTKDTAAPSASAIAAVNKTGGTAGLPEQGDQIVFTFSEQMNLASLSGASVTVRITNSGGNDPISVVGANYGTIANSGGNFVSTNRDFTSSGVVQVGAVVTITLGTASGAVSTDTTSTLTWNPSASATDLAGNAMSTTARAEVGGADTDF